MASFERKYQHLKALANNFIYRPERLNVKSSGAGTQSNAIICLIYKGVLPKPDIIVMSDVGREASNVFTYREQYILPLCDEMGLEYVIIDKSKYATYDLVGASPDAPLPGYFTELNGRKNDGTCKGKQPAFCSDKWKKEVIQRYLNERYGEKELTKRGVDTWFGISVEEAPRRARQVPGKWQRRYPLVDLNITQEECVSIVESLGLPTPPRSLCWMCPNRSNEMWHWMRENVPEDFEKACSHEKEIQQSWSHLWLTKYGQPLDEVIRNIYG
jgi:hypothetical protein